MSEANDLAKNMSTTSNCPECRSTFILRVKRKWYHKLLGHKLHYCCHDCNAHFWNDITNHHSSTFIILRVRRKWYHKLLGHRLHYFWDDITDHYNSKFTSVDR